LVRNLFLLKKQEVETLESKIFPWESYSNKKISVHRYHNIRP